MFISQSKTQSHTTALLAVAALAAHASADFQYPSSVTSSFVTLEDPPQGDHIQEFLTTYNGSAEVDLETPNLHGSATIYASPTSFGGNLSLTPGRRSAAGLGDVSIIASGVTVPEPTDVLFEWDLANFTGQNVLGDYEIIIENADTLENIFNASEGTAGSHVFTLEPGTPYNFTVRFAVSIDEESPNAEFFGSFTIVPAPSAASIFMVTGFAAARRRRN